MQRQERIASVAEGEWGRAVVYDVEKVPETIDETSELMRTMSTKISAKSKSSLRVIDDPAIQSVLAGSRSTMSDDENLWTLEYFPASLFATILEDTITQLRILTECNNSLRITKTMSDIKKLRAIKFGVTQLIVKDELDGIDPERLDCQEYKIAKLDSDRNYFSDVLMSIYRELSIDKKFKELVSAVIAVEEDERNREYLIEDEAKNKITRRELAKQLRLQRNQQKSAVYDTEVIIDTLKTEVEDAALMAETRSRYVDNWQSARTEQHKQTIFEKEFTNTDSISYYKQRTDHEQRVHSEMELLTNIAINETLQKVEDWMEKYEIDMEQIDLNIQIKKNEYENMLDKRKYLDSKYERHDLQMKAWKEFKEEREKQRQYHDKMTKSAIIVQAWWRGLIVRRELGPYRVRKKGKGAKKK